MSIYLIYIYIDVGILARMCFRDPCLPPLSTWFKQTFWWDRKFEVQFQNNNDIDIRYIHAQKSGSNSNLFYLKFKSYFALHNL